MLSPTQFVSSFLFIESVSFGLKMAAPPFLEHCVTVIRIYRFSFAQHQLSRRDTSACHYGMTADIRCVFSASVHLFAVDL